jgi:hypothetical protein
MIKVPKPTRSWTKVYAALAEAPLDVAQLAASLTPEGSDADPAISELEAARTLRDMAESGLVQATGSLWTQVRGLEVLEPSLDGGYAIEHPGD